MGGSLFNEILREACVNCLQTHYLKHYRILTKLSGFHIPNPISLGPLKVTYSPMMVTTILREPP